MSGPDFGSQNGGSYAQGGFRFFLAAKTMGDKPILDLSFGFPTAGHMLKLSSDFLAAKTAGDKPM